MGRIKIHPLSSHLYVERSVTLKKKRFLMEVVTLMLSTLKHDSFNVFILLSFMA